MKDARLEEMSKGWFVGDFAPSLLKTGEVEVAVKHYQAGDYELPHMHKIATELTVIVSGEVEMNGVRYASGDIVVIEPGEYTDFRVLSDTVATVVKVPGAVHDKYDVDGDLLC